jgi:PPE-repeat protein
MSFVLFPPEFNSALMYTGAGSGPLLDAASAWDTLAADLESTATSYQTVITNLTTGPWLGSASTSMATAAQPYVAWLETTAAQAAQTGAQAKSAAAAYQSAFSSIVPPALITANRSLYTQLVANNLLGQNAPLIAAAETQYMDMWFQDGLTMDTYSVASHQATATLSQVTAAPQVSDGGVSADAAAAAQSTASATSADATSVLTDLEALFNALVSGGNYTTQAGTVLTDLGVPESLVTDITTSLASAIADPSAALLPIQEAYYAGMMASMPARMFMSSGGSSGAGAASGLLVNSPEALLDKVATLVDSKMQTVAGGVARQLGSWGSAMGHMAGAHQVGGLSVPHGWQTGPEMVRAAPTLPGTSVAAPSLSSPGLASSPFTQALIGAMGARGIGSMASKIPAPKVVPRSPAGG